MSDKLKTYGKFGAKVNEDHYACYLPKVSQARKIVICLWLMRQLKVTRRRWIREFGYPAPQCCGSCLSSSFGQQRSFRQDLQRPSSNCASLTGVMRLIIVSV